MYTNIFYYYYYMNLLDIDYKNKWINQLNQGWLGFEDLE